MRQNKHYLLIGHAGFSNRGCQAIVCGTVQAIREKDPQAWITLASREADSDRDICSRQSIAIDLVINAYGRYPRRTLPWALQAIHRRLTHRHLTHYDYILRNAYASHQVVVSIGGDNFTDDYGHAGACFASLVAAREAGARTAIWAASIGPFKNPDEAGRWAEILRGVDLITVRETLARDYLAEIGVRHNVHLVADPAFLMKPRRPAPPPSRPSGLLVGINVSDLLAASPTTGEAYTATMVAFVHLLVTQRQAQVRLVPHVVTGGGTTNDPCACAAVATKSDCGSAVTVLGSDLTAEELKYAIAECDYFVGARTHSTIASLSSAVPTLSIAYSPKAFGINRALLGTEAYVIPAAEVTAESLLARFDRMVAERTTIVDLLHRQCSQARALAQEGAALLHELLVRQTPSPHGKT